MQHSNKSERERYAGFRRHPPRARFGFGRKVALLNVDLQKAYTLPSEFSTAYETHPQQIDQVNALSARCRSLGAPVVWTHVAYLPSGEDCGVLGTRTDTPDSRQNVKLASRRAEFDLRLRAGQRRG